MKEASSEPPKYTTVDFETEHSGSASEAVIFGIGDLVRVMGLQSKQGQKMNGRCGEIESEHNGRFSVLLNPMGSDVTGGNGVTDGAADTQSAAAEEDEGGHQGSVVRAAIRPAMALETSATQQDT